MQANLWISANNIATASSASDMTEKKVAEWSLGPALNELFQNYSASQNHCLLEVFQGPICAGSAERATIQLARQRLATWREQVLAQTGRSLPKAARLSPPSAANMAGYWQLATGKAERALVGWTPLTGLAAAEAPLVSG